jgi:hypothetical protein
MMKKLLFSFSTVALASAFAASSYSVTLFDEGVLDGKSLAPGQYKMQVNDESVVLKHNKDVTEVPAKTELTDKKFSTTSVLYNDQHQVTGIEIGGTNKKIVFGHASAQKGGHSPSVDSVIK